MILRYWAALWEWLGPLLTQKLEYLSPSLCCIVCIITCNKPFCVLSLLRGFHVKIQQTSQKKICNASLRNENTCLLLLKLAKNIICSCWYNVYKEFWNRIWSLSHFLGFRLQSELVTTLLVTWILSITKLENYIGCNFELHEKIKIIISTYIFLANQISA